MFTQIFKEGNTATSALAKLGLRLQYGESLNAETDVFFWKVMFTQIFKEGNTATSVLAKLGLRLQYKESKRWNTQSKSF